MAMPPRSSSAFKNALLTRLSPQQFDRLAPRLQPLEFEVKQVIYEPHHPIQYAYFVETGMIAVVSIMGDGKSIDVGTIGKEGLAGGTLLLGIETVIHRYDVQIAGHGYRLTAAALKEETERDREFRDLVLRYQAAFLTQTMQAAACNGLHSVQQRCCRWLLTSQDRAEADAVPLTHELLALMLGVHRASVTEVLQPLQERGWVQKGRGEITILNREGLESGACECYRIIKDQHERMLK